MKKLILVAALSVCMPAMAQTAFTVNGQLISVQQQKQLMDVLAAQGVTDKKQQEEAARGILTQQTIIAQLAHKEKVDELPAVKALLDERRTQVFTNELIRKNALSKPATQKELEEAYEKAKKSYDPHEVAVRHILVKTEGEAKDLIEKIKGGADMAALATEKTLDRSTAPAGGAIPFTNIRRIAIPGFAEAAVAMKNGDLLPVPFKSNLGFHVIKLEDKREVPFPPLDQVKPQLEALVAQEKAQEYLTNVIKSAKVADAPAGKPTRSNRK